MKKIGLICLALVLALGTLGVGFAHWSQTLYVDTTVKTGSVDVGFLDAYSYDPCVALCDPGELFDEDLLDGDTGKNVAGCWVVMTDQKGTKIVNEVPVPVYETVEITVCNGYPCYTNLCDLVVTNFGTIPVKVELMQVQLPDQSWVDVTPGTWYDYDYNGDQLPDVNVMVSSVVVGDQIDPCETDVVYFDIHVKQDCPQGATFSISAKLKFTQWNLVK